MLWDHVAYESLNSLSEVFPFVDQDRSFLCAMLAYVYRRPSILSSTHDGCGNKPAPIRIETSINYLPCMASKLSCRTQKNVRLSPSVYVLGFWPGGPWFWSRSGYNFVILMEDRKYATIN
jgi:hypothetical protein